MVASGVASAGCTKILGIDGTYAYDGVKPASTVTDDGRDASRPPHDSSVVTPAKEAGPHPDAAPARECAAGKYSGTFKGASSLSLGTQLDGTIVFTLAPVAGSTTQFQLENGNLDGTFDGTNAGSVAALAHFDATVVGTLDCRTGNLTGSLTNGAYQLVNLLGIITTPPTPFTGTIDATYDPSSASFPSGTWTETHSVGGSQGSGSGTWQAKGPGP